MNHRIRIAAVIVGAVGVMGVGGQSYAQTCDDFNECTTNPMCQADGSCQGTPANDGTPCADVSACMTNATCQGGICTGTPLADGTACSFPELGACFGPGQCRFGFCVPGAPKVCPTPTDPCQIAFCNPQSGDCQNVDKCNFGGSNPCSVCNAGVCQPTKEGEACDDFSECTSNDRCQDGFCTGQVGGGVGCVGDCNGDGEVTIDELLKLVNIALGNSALADCPAGDADGSGDITINEIIAAVNNALNGCPA